MNLMLFIRRTSAQPVQPQFHEKLRNDAGWTLCFLFIFTTVTDSGQKSKEVDGRVFDQELSKKELKEGGVEDDIICVVQS